jgi:hypothetical protein
LVIGVLVIGVLVIGVLVIGVLVISVLVIGGNWCWCAAPLGHFRPIFLSTAPVPCT